MAQNGTAWRQMAQMTLKHFPWVYNMIICHVGPPWALFRGPRGRIMAENSTKNGPLWPKLAIHDPKWPCMTPNGPKTLPMDILHDNMPYWTTLGPFQRPKGVQKLPKTSPSWPNISPKLIFMTPNVPTWPQIAQIHFPWLYYMVLFTFQRPTGATLAS